MTRYQRRIAKLVRNRQSELHIATIARQCQECIYDPKYNAQCQNTIGSACDREIEMSDSWHLGNVGNVPRQITLYLRGYYTFRLELYHP